MWDLDRRKFLIGAAGTAAVSMIGSSAASAADNAIVTENQNPGSTAWQLTNPANDDLSQLGAYVRQDSVTSGQTLELCVLVPEDTSVSAQVFRLGWYGGSRARLMRNLATTTVNGSDPLTTRPDTGETESTAPPAFSFNIPGNWLSGLYVVRVRTAAGVDTHATFAVRDNRQADLVMSQPILTYAAYTNTPRPLGKSLYDGQSGGAETTRGTQRATEISLDRPYRNSGSGDLFYWDHDLLSWLEREGYDVTYVTNLDIDRSPATLRRGKVAVVSGHDEYWTQAMMDAYLSARDAGVHITNFGANCAYWRVRTAASRDGRNRRRVICWKYAAGENSNTPTILFKDTNTPMQGLWGVDFMDFADFIEGPYTPVVPVSEDHWFWAGTGVENDQPLPSNIMGYEVDRRNFSVPLPTNVEYTYLTISPFTGQEFGFNFAHGVIYQTPGDTWVFSGGTTSWAWGLIRPGLAHPAIQQGTRNLLNRLTGGDDPPNPSLPAPSPFETTFQDRRRVVLKYGRVAGASDHEVFRDGELVGTDNDGWYTDLGLEPGTTYSYRMRALAADGTPGEFTPDLSVTTRGDGGGGLPAPTPFETTFQDRSRIVLKYGEVDGATGHEVFRDGVLVGTDNDGWYTDRDLTAGTTYVYRMRAVAADGARGAFTPELSVTTRGGGGQLPAPTGFRTTFQDRRRAVLNWQRVTGAAGYEILRDDVVVATDDNGWYTDLDLEPGTTYRYQVRAIAADGTTGVLTGRLSVTTRA